MRNNRNAHYTLVVIEENAIHAVFGPFSSEDDAIAFVDVLEADSAEAIAPSTFTYHVQELVAPRIRAFR